jgi:hypothetical protein
VIAYAQSAPGVRTNNIDTAQNAATMATGIDVTLFSSRPGRRWKG